VAVEARVERRQQPADSLEYNLSATALADLTLDLGGH